MNSFDRAVSAMSGEANSNAISLKSYQEAMVFYGARDEWIRCKFAIMLYARQLLICLGKDIDEDCLDVSKISKMFLQEESFRHMHTLFNLKGTVRDLVNLIDIMSGELCKHVSYDSLDYETSDEQMWWNILRSKVISSVRREVSEDIAQFLEELEIRGKFTRLLWDDMNIYECAGYAWIGKEAAMRYGYKESKAYSTIFMEWCRRNSVTDMEAEKSRLYALFTVVDDKRLDEILLKNMNN